MSCLDATFTLTPRSPFYSDTLNNYASLFCYGADFLPGSGWDFSSLYASNRFYFDNYFAADPNLDYTQSVNNKKVQLLRCDINLPSYAGANKELALIFGFDVLGGPGRVLIYTDASKLQDLQLVSGDNQLLLEIESLAQPVTLYFIHAGGYWFFTGLSGYVV